MCRSCVLFLFGDHEAKHQDIGGTHGVLCVVVRAQVYVRFITETFEDGNMLSSCFRKEGMCSMWEFKLSKTPCILLLWPSSTLLLFLLECRPQDKNDVAPTVVHFLTAYVTFCWHLHLFTFVYMKYLFVIMVLLDPYGDVYRRMFSMPVVVRVFASFIRRKLWSYMF